ncbi:unnamed protein product [Amoebophrya sp. A120]|nr:unnamed protein product [Amoebophrya sp. A120]|eukprot:GSA120T00017327001.1
MSRRAFLLVGAWLSSVCSTSASHDDVAASGGIIEAVDDHSGAVDRQRFLRNEHSDRSPSVSVAQEEEIADVTPNTTVLGGIPRTDDYLPTNASSSSSATARRFRPHRGPTATTIQAGSSSTSSAAVPGSGLVQGRRAVITASSSMIRSSELESEWVDNYEDHLVVSSKGDQQNVTVASKPSRAATDVLRGSALLQFLNATNCTDNATNCTNETAAAPAKKTTATEEETPGLFPEWMSFGSALDLAKFVATNGMIIGLLCAVIYFVQTQRDSIVYEDDVYDSRAGATQEEIEEKRLERKLRKRKEKDDEKIQEEVIEEALQ